MGMGSTVLGVRSGSAASAFFGWGTCGNADNLGFFWPIGCSRSQQEIDDFQRNVDRVGPRYAVLVTPLRVQDQGGPNNLPISQKLINSAILCDVCADQWRIYVHGLSGSRLGFLSPKGNRCVTSRKPDGWVTLRIWAERYYASGRYSQFHRSPRDNTNRPKMIFLRSASHTLRCLKYKTPDVLVQSGR